MNLSEEIEQRIQKMLDQEQREILDVTQVRDLIERIFERGMYVSSMEAVELASDGSLPLRLDFSILGLESDWDDRAPRDAAFAREVLEAKLAAAAYCTNRVEFAVWLDDLAQGRSWV